MATVAQTQSRRMYSWWWDSHISPKNSKWLQDNLTDMDSKLKAMIKLIEEDADSFARRAEMYYKKRPELMKLVEDFYRAYRALAERYDHATVVIRQAHRTMTEAFPNQVPPILGDDSPAYSASEDEPRTPDSVHTHAPFQTDDFQKDAFEASSSHYYDVKSNEENAEGSDSAAWKKGFKQSNNLFGSGDSHKFGERRVRKGLNFQDTDEKEQSGECDKGHSFQASSQSGQVHEPEEILKLRKALAELEAEKDAGLIQYQQSLDKLSKLEAEISRAQEDCRELGKRAATAEAEVQTLKEAINKLEAVKDANLLQYHQYLEKISSLEDVISQAETTARELEERASTAETQAQSLKDEIAKLTSEKDAALDQYVLSLDKISNLENRLELAEENARKSSEQAEIAAREIESLWQKISKLSEEKEGAATQYKHSLETISSLENKLSSSQEEAERLRIEIDTGVAKLKGAEEQCAMLERSNQSLHAELEALMLKMGTQVQELSEKQKEVSRLWSSVQEERLRFVEAETAFQTLQHLHAKVQEELLSVASELQNRVQMLKGAKAHIQELQNEVLKIKEENLSLNELNVSSALSINNMQEEIIILKDAKGKLKEEAELRVDQRNALQQEIYCLKEELNDLNTKHLSILEQVHAVGFKPETLKSSVTELQDEKSSLKESCKRERSEKQALLEKLEILGQLLEKNSILENSLLDLSAELEAVRGKINALEESCHFLLKEKSILLDEKASLGSQLQAANNNLEKLSEKNTVLENSLSDAHDELQTLKGKSKSLEDSCQLLADEKVGLDIEKDNLSTELETTLLRLEEQEKKLAELQERYLTVEKDKASALHKIEELETSLDEEKQEHSTFAQINEKRFAVMQSEMHLLQEQFQLRKREYDIELDRALHSDIEIFILQRSGEDLKEANKSLSIKYEKLLEASTLSENLISQLQKENIEQQNTARSLSHQTSILRKGIFPLLEAFDVVLDGACQDTIEQDLLNLTSVLHKIEELKQSLGKSEEENQRLGLEKMALVTLLQQLRLDAEGLAVERSNIEQELKTRNEHFMQKIEEIKQSLGKTEEENQQLGLEKTALVTLLQQVRLDAEGLAVERSSIKQELKTRNELFMQKIEEIKQSLGKTEEENQQLGLEKMALVTLLQQLRLDAEGLAVEKSSIEQELETRNEHFMQKIEEIKQFLGKTEEENQQLGLEKMTLVTLLQQLRLDAEGLAVEKSSIEQELETRNEHVSVLQGEVVKLQNMNEELKVEMTEGNHREGTLMTELGSLQSNLLEVKGSLKNLHAENSKILEEKQSLTDETLLLKDSNYTLEEENCVMCGELLSTDYLSLIFKNFVDEKNLNIRELGEHLRKLQLVTDTIQEKLNSTERTIEEIQIENHGLREILKKSEDELKVVTGIKDILSHEIETAKNLLHEEQEKANLQKEIFQSELQKQMNENEILESNEAALFGQLQISTVYLVLCEQKIHELTEAFDGISDANTVKDNDIKLLEERVTMLTAENEGLNVQLAAYSPAVTSLRNSISSLENKTSSQGKIHKAENGDVKDTEVPNDQDEDNFVGDENVVVSDTFLELQNLQNRIQAIEQNVVAEEQLFMQEKSDVHAQLEAALRQIEELKSESSRRKNFKAKTSEAENVLLTKDIILDEASESSPNGNSWKQQVEPDKPDQDDRIGPAVDSAKQTRKLEGEYPASDAPLEKELSIDRLEFSKNSMDLIQEGNNRKVLQRLNSDVQKLMNLHITVQDLKKKLENTGKSKKGKAVDESNTLKEQLEEAEATILQLFDLNGNLMKNMEGGSFSSDHKSTKESGDFGSARREISGQARRVSEKIGRLQLEIQKIQFVLLKLDEKRESRGRKNPSDTSRRVLLRDYIYGGLRTNHTKGKKSPFCACIQPKTTGD